MQGYGSRLACKWARPKFNYKISQPTPFMPFTVTCICLCRMGFFIPKPPCLISFHGIVRVKWKKSHMYAYIGQISMFDQQFCTITVFVAETMLTVHLFVRLFTLILVHSTLKSPRLSCRINQGSLKATTAETQLFSILSNHMIRVSAPHPQCREGPGSAQLTTILCGYLASFV